MPNPRAWILLLTAMTVGCYEAPGVCTPSCTGRVCGPDPACGLSCGDCSPDKRCDDWGHCISVVEEEPDAGIGDDGDPGTTDAGDHGTDEADRAPVDEAPLPCTNPDPDCSAPAAAAQGDQGLDVDADGWGACCDCSDDDPDVNPGVLETAGDEIDNDCNGIADEPGGKMVKVPFDEVYIDVYEGAIFEHPDCSGTRFGNGVNDYPAAWPPEGVASTTLYACSLPGIQPSGYLSWYQARRACEAQGKRLCDDHWWSNACGGVPFRIFPYGDSFVSGLCNDAIGGQGHATATGSLPACRSESGVYDQSGNMSEWLQSLDPDHVGRALVAGFSYACEFYAPWDDDFYSCDLDNPDHVDNVRQASDCAAGDRVEETMPFVTIRPYLGTRCCLEVD